MAAGDYSIEFVYGVRVSSPNPSDPREGPWSSLGTALAGIPSGVRYPGLEFKVTDGSNNVTRYHFNGGVSDGDAEEITGGGITPSDIVNNLESDATDKALSAAQGKALKTLIDGIVSVSRSVSTYAGLPNDAKDQENIFVEDASGAPNVTSGWAIFKSIGDQPSGNYVKIMEEEGLDIDLVSQVNLQKAYDNGNGIITLKDEGAWDKPFEIKSFEEGVFSASFFGDSLYMVAGSDYFNFYGGDTTFHSAGAEIRFNDGNINITGRVVNVDDPVGSKDAANKRWSLAQIAPLTDIEVVAVSSATATIDVENNAYKRAYITVEEDIEVLLANSGSAKTIELNLFLLGGPFSITLPSSFTSFDQRWVEANDEITLPAGYYKIVAINVSGLWRFVVTPEEPESAGITNLSISRDASQVTIQSDTGTDASIPTADGSNAGAMTASAYTNLTLLESTRQALSTISTIAPSAGVVTIDFNSLPFKQVYVDTPAADFEIQHSNDTNALIVDYSFTLGSARVITFPSAYISNDYRWDGVAYELSLDAGKWEAQAKKVDGEWRLAIMITSF